MPVQPTKIRQIYKGWVESHDPGRKLNVNSGQLVSHYQAHSWTWTLKRQTTEKGQHNHQAATNGRKNMLQLFLDRGQILMSRNKADENRCTTLHGSAENDNGPTLLCWWGSNELCILTYRVFLYTWCVRRRNLKANWDEDMSLHFDKRGQ